jgi:tRNA(adenine34) deaminase
LTGKKLHQADYERLMSDAIDVAQSALISGDVPVGALVINPQGEVVGTGHNLRELNHDPTAHAEIVALREAALVANNWRLDGHTLIVTLEPCAMCAGAIAQARISTVVFGAWDSKAGAVGSIWDILRDPRSPHQVDVIAGIKADECATLLAEFFKAIR